MILETTRSVQETKMGSKFITLDKQWIKHNNIKKQDKVMEISEGDISIIIAPNSEFIQDINKLNELKKILENLTHKE